MANELEVQRRPCAQLTTDFLAEDRQELVAKLAYQRWQERSCPLGLPEVDWFAAECDLYEIFGRIWIGFTIRG